MYHLVKTDGGFEVRDENDLTVARTNVEAAGLEIVAALNLVQRAVEEFPGLRDDTDVNGAGLVDLFNDSLVFEAERYREREVRRREQGMRFRTDLAALLDYCEEDEWEDFVGYLAENGAEELSEEEVERLEEDTDEAKALLDRECLSPEQNHIYAVIHRLRKAAGE